MKRGTPDHPKTLWLKAGLNLSKVEVVGVLELFFHFTARCSPQGDVGKWTNRQIAEGVDWGRDPDELVAQLTAAGFLDADRRHRLLVHDWAEHADQAVKKYLARNGLEFLTPSGRVRTRAGHVRTKDVHGRTAVAVAKPSQAKPEPSPAESPSSGDPPGFLEPLRCPDCGNNNAVIRGREEFGGGWVCWRKEGGCGQVFDLHDPSIWKQLSPRAIASIGARIARESGNYGGTLVQDYENIKPEDHVLFEIRGVLAAEFAAWYQEHPEAGFLVGQRDMGTAFGDWPRRASLPLWIAALVLREAVELSNVAVEITEEKPA